MRRFEVIALAIIFLVGFIVRLYRLDNPVAEWHSWRQSDTSAVSKNFVTRGFDVLHPRYFDISNVQSGKNNPEGYRFVEFPIYNLAQAGLFKLFNYFTLIKSGFTLEEWGRIVSIFSSLFSALFLFLLVKKHTGKIEGILSSFFFLFLPFSIYYSRTILPETTMTMAILGGTYFFDKWLEESAKLKTKNAKLQLKAQSFFIVSAILVASSFLLKPFALFFALPMIYLAYKKFGLSIIVRWQLWLFAAFTLAPFIWWRSWIAQYPEGIPSSNWLFNGDNVRFKPFWFRWILWERLTKLISGYGGVLLGGLGVFGLLGRRRKEDILFPLSFGASSILYITVIARGNLQHDYYQALIIPTISIFLSLGSTFLISFLSRFNRPFAFIVVSILIISSFAFSWYKVRDYFNINNRAMVAAGKKADQILPINSKVIAPYNGDTTLLYFISRPGWPIFQNSIENMIKKMGATHLVIVSPTKSDFEGFGKMYPILAQSKEYLILNLR